MRNSLLILALIAGISGCAAEPTRPVPVTPPSATADSSAAMPRPAARFGLVEGKLVLRSDAGDWPVDSVPYPGGDGAMIGVPGGQVVKRVVTLHGRHYRLDHFDGQMINGDAVPTLEAITELPPDRPCPAASDAPLPELWAWSITAQSPPLGDEVIDGMKVRGRTKARWRCLAHAPRGAALVVGGRKVKDIKSWMAELYSTATYTHQDMIADARLVRERSDNAEFLNQRQAYDFHHRCGAMVIARDWLVTAQHCIINADGVVDPVYFAKWRRIRVNTLDLTKGGSTVGIKRIVLYPGYDADTHRHDIALIQTDTPLDVLPIRILGTHDRDAEPAQHIQKFTAYGWGTQSPRADSDSSHRDDFGHIVHGSRELLAVDLDYVPRDRCARDLAMNSALAAGRICAGYAPGGRDTCQGDSGGPLVVKMHVPAWDDREVLAGIVSSGKGCAQANSPGEYTYVPFYLWWIVSVVGAGVLSP